MRSKIVSVIISALILTGMLSFAFDIRPVKAVGLSPIYILADGDLSPSSAPIQRNGNYYTLNGSITSNSDGIIIQKNNVTIDGAGYTLNGSGFNAGGHGFNLTGINHLTIKNFNDGIWLSSSSNNTVSGNNVANNGIGIDIVSSSSNDTVSGNNITNNRDGIVLAYSSNYNTVSGNNVTSNTQRGVWLDLSSNNTVSGNSITANNLAGIDLEYSSNNSISGNNIANNGYGIELYSSFNNTVSGNNITSNIWYGIGLVSSSSYNTVSGNNVANNGIGIGLVSSSSNTVSGNNVTNNWHGIYLVSSSSNTVYHNNFVNNTKQAYPSSSANVWDDGYPSGGNYWSDYTGVDANHDGIGDTPYVIDSNNQDRYPLMHPWSPLPVHNINTGLGYATIQAAIDAPETLNGHTIEADAGTYCEHLVISKSIFLIGEIRNTTIIDGNGTGPVVTLSADNVSVANFMIRNGGHAWSPMDTCIWGHNLSNILIENNTVMDVSNGIIFYGLCNSSMIHNFAEDCGAMGLHFDSSSNCKMVNNTVINSFQGIVVEKSAGNFIQGNNLISNNVSIQLYASAGNLVEGNNLVNSNVSIILIASNGINVFQNNNMTSNTCNLMVWGSSLEAFMQRIDTSNIANNKRVYYITDSRDLLLDPPNCPNIGYLALVNCTHVTVKDIDLSNDNDGMLMAQSTNCSLVNMTLANSRTNITLRAFSPQPIIHGGLTFFRSDNNLVTNSRITNNSVGVCLYQSSGNLFYHDSFVAVDKPVISNFQSPGLPPSGSCSMNKWDNGLEGNYWSDYTGNDSDHDGIGDSPYAVDANNTDNYPLMGPFVEFNAGTWNGTQYSVDIVSNSTLANFNFNATSKTIMFDVEGQSGTTGFCRVDIPKSLLWSDNKDKWTVIVGGVLASPNVIENGNYTYIYFSYTHSTHEVKITGTNAVPEFPSALATTLIIVTTLFATILLAKKRKPKTQPLPCQQKHL